MTKNYITAAGFQKMKAELKKLIHHDRPEGVKVVAWAASNGDRSENGDYLYGKKKLREMDRRIRFLTGRLESAEVVEPQPGVGLRVLFGMQVQVAVLDDVGDNQVKQYWIVGQDEADAATGAVSWRSPVAAALLNRLVGEEVTVQTPGGQVELKILGVSYPQN